MKSIQSANVSHLISINVSKKKMIKRKKRHYYISAAYSITCFLDAKKRLNKRVRLSFFAVSVLSRGTLKWSAELETGLSGVGAGLFSHSFIQAPEYLISPPYE